MKKIPILLLLIPLLLFTSSCSKEEEQVTTQEKEYFEFEPVTDIKEGRENIYVVLKVLTSQYWQDVVRGITEGGMERDCNIYVGASVGEGDDTAVSSQKMLLEQAMKNKADSIIIAPSSSSALNEELKEIHNKNKPVILVDTIMNDTSCFDTCYMTDNLSAGELAAEEMIRLLEKKGVSHNEKAQVAIQITSSSSQTVIDRLAGFNQYWAANAPEEWTVLDEVKFNNGDKDIAKKNCMDFISENPDLKGLFGCNNSSTVGNVNGLTETGRKDLVLVGFDYADETAALVGSNEWNASVVVQNQYDMGYKGINTALDILEGKPAEYKFDDTGTLVINHENHLEYEKELASAGEVKK